MNTKILALASVLFASASLAACDDGLEDVTSSDFEFTLIDDAVVPAAPFELTSVPAQATVQVLIREEGGEPPKGIEAVSLSVVSVQVMRYGPLGEEVWTTISDGDQSIDLLGTVSPDVEKIGMRDLYEGEYAALSLSLGRSTVWFEDNEEVLSLPGQTIMLEGGFDLMDLEQTTLTLTVDGVQHIVPGERGFDMDPELRLAVRYE